MSLLTKKKVFVGLGILVVAAGMTVGALVMFAPKASKETAGDREDMLCVLDDTPGLKDRKTYCYPRNPAPWDD